MSDKPSILEGGSSRNFNPVDVLGINKQSNGRSTWVLADSVEVGSLDASKNGLYLAIEDDYFAYDQIVVNVSDDLADADDATKATDKIVGKDPDLDPNNDYAVGLDDDGNLTKEMIPSAIHIVVPPRKLKYEDGETIDFDGIHVYLMDGNNHRYTDSSYPTGEIPFSELTFPVTEASGSGASQYATGGLLPQYGISEIPITSGVINATNKDSELFKVESSAATFVFMYMNDDVQFHFLLATKTENERVATTYNSSSEYRNDIYASSSYVNGNKTAYYSVFTSGTNWDASDGASVSSGYTKLLSTSGSPAELAWSMLYGTIHGGTGNEIPVQWMRSDGETLEDTFEIEIVSEPAPVPEPQPDPWGGYADVSWNGHHYNLNRRIVPEVHYANGYLWQEGISTEYSVEQAASMGWLILIR